MSPPRKKAKTKTAAKTAARKTAKRKPKPARGSLSQDYFRKGK